MSHHALKLFIKRFIKPIVNFSAQQIRQTYPAVIYSLEYVFIYLPLQCVKLTIVVRDYNAE